MSGLNPTVFLHFPALLPPFTDATAPWSVPLQMIALGRVHTVSCGAIYLLVGFGSSVVRAARPGAARLVTLRVCMALTISSWSRLTGEAVLAEMPGADRVEE